MQLHRVLGKPDWADVRPEQRNQWQRLAAASNGILTPANLTTVVGLAMVVYGLVAIHREQFWLGLVMLSVGRFADVLDGFLADKTGTKSPLGEAVDVVADKAATVFTVLLFFTDKLAPWPLLLLALTPQVIIMVLPLFQWRHGDRLHPSRTGKLSMAILWVSLVGLILVPALNASHTWLKLLFDFGLLLSAALNFYTVSKYMRLQD